jgi:hypothetical protein
MVYLSKDTDMINDLLLFQVSSLKRNNRKNRQCYEKTTLLLKRYTDIILCLLFRLNANHFVEYAHTIYR